MKTPSPIFPNPISQAEYGPIEAGFVSPALDYLKTPVDVAKLVAPYPASTYYLRVRGQSMYPMLNDGDILAINKFITPVHGKIVIAAINGEFTVKRLFKKDGFMSLNPDNPDFNPIIMETGMEVQIWGVVYFILRKA